MFQLKHRQGKSASSSSTHVSCSKTVASTEEREFTTTDSAPNLISQVAREGRPATPYELSGRSCLLQGHNPAWEQWHFIREGEEAHILVQGKVRANHYSTVLQLARAGMGYAKCPLMLVESLLTAGELVTVLDEWQSGLHQLHVLHAQQRRVPRKIRLFKQVLAQWFAERPNYLL